MNALFDQRGKRLRLGKKLGEGGEGAVYEIVEIQQFVAKLYHEKPDLAKAEKLASMVALASGNKRLMEVAAWPVATLHGHASGPLVGIGMPRVTGGREIHDLYGPSFRKLHFPNADWRFLLQVARRCAAAFDELHAAGIVLGDVNQGNVLVFPDGRIRLIDCDSFQLTHNGKTFLCGVGVGHFTPPELQSVDFSKAVRTANHDRFGLAVLIFHLLFAGRHPFAGRFLGAGDPPLIEDAIVQRRFAYASWGRQVLMAPPPNVPTLHIVPPDFGRLFEKAFGPGAEVANARPAPKEWTVALDRLLGAVRRCNQSPGHFFAKHLTACPWCEIEKTGGPDYFISVTLTATIAKGHSFDLVKFWAAVTSVPDPSTILRNRPPTISSPVPHALEASATAGRGLQSAVAIVSCISCAMLLLSFLMPGIAPFAVFLTVTFSIWWTGLVVTSPLWRLRQERIEALTASKKQLARLEGERTTVAQRGKLAYQSCRRELDQLRTTYESLTSQKEAEHQRLKQTTRERQLAAFLRTRFIRDAKITGIGPARVSTLEALGVETAYDVTFDAVQIVPGFGQKLTLTLIYWRQQIEAEFRFNPATGIPKSDLDALEMGFLQRRRKLEISLQEKLALLKRTVAMTEKQFTAFDERFSKAVQAVAQARADARVLPSMREMVFPSVWSK